MSSEEEEGDAGAEEEGEPIEMLVMDRHQLKQRVMSNNKPLGGGGGGKNISARDLFFGKNATRPVTAGSSSKQSKAAAAKHTSVDGGEGGAVARKRILGGVMMDIPLADDDEAEKRQKTAKERRKLNRVWRPTAEYKMVREGPVLTCHPDEHPHLQEHMLTIFKNVNPEVEFAEDPNTPLWVGVLKLDANQFEQQGDDGYYEPKLPHFKQMYAERPAKKFPADNMALSMDGGESLPYWVDKYKLNKDKEKSQKQKSKNKKKQKAVAAATPLEPIREQHQGEMYSTSVVGGLEMFSDPNDLATGRTNAGEEDEDDDDSDDDKQHGEDAPPPPPRVSAKTTTKKRARRSNDSADVPAASAAAARTNNNNLLADGAHIPDFERYVFPLSGWMYTTTMMKGASKQIISKSSMLKPSPAERLAKTGAQTLQHVGRMDGIAISPPPPPPHPKDSDAAPVPAPAVAVAAVNVVTFENFMGNPANPAKTAMYERREEPNNNNNRVKDALMIDIHMAKRAKDALMLDIHMAKHAYVASQIAAFKQGTAVHPLFHAYFSGAKTMDPTTLLAEFVEFLGKEM